MIWRVREGDERQGPQPFGEELLGRGLRHREVRVLMECMYPKEVKAELVQTILQWEVMEPND